MFVVMRKRGDEWLDPFAGGFIFESGFLFVCLKLYILAANGKLEYASPGRTKLHSCCTRMPAPVNLLQTPGYDLSHTAHCVTQTEVIAVLLAFV